MKSRILLPSVLVLTVAVPVPAAAHGSPEPTSPEPTSSTNPSGPIPLPVASAGASTAGGTGPVRTAKTDFAARDRFLTNGMIISGAIGGASLVAGTIYFIVTSVPGALPSHSDPSELYYVNDSFLPIIVGATLLTIGGIGAITFGGFAGVRRKHRRNGQRLQIGPGGGLVLRF